MEDNLVLNENAYFYKKPDGYKLYKKDIESLFKDAIGASKAIGSSLYQVVKKITTKNDQISYSICIFKYETKPTFIDEPIDKWTEVKLAYLILIDFDNYIVISKRNISGISDFIKTLEPIDYKILSTIFIKEESQFEKFSLKNMSISNSSIRSKSLEAINLQDNFATLGANNYILDNVRINTNNEKIALSLGTSRINKFSAKSSLDVFIEWSESLIEMIDSYEEQDTFLSVFAEPQDFEGMRHDLIPIAILFLFTKLYEDFENGRIQSFKYYYDGDYRIIDIFEYLKSFERLLQIECVEENDSIYYVAKSDVINDLEIRINKKSITINSRKLNSLMLVKDSGHEMKFLDYLNMSNQFLINFDYLDLIYTNRKLFKDTKLLGNMDYFMDVFIPFEALINVTSEKGNYTTDSTFFDMNSIFGFVESTFVTDYNYFVCDDLQKEWADHIGLQDGKVSFFHSKYKNSNYSASAFQDVVGQALKNISSLSPERYLLETKRLFWQSNYSNNSVSTAISRVRKGNSVDDFIVTFNSLTSYSNLTREIYLVINFISKEGLKTKLQQLRDGEAFTERNEIIQILWFISSFVSSCSEQGVKAYICCKP